MNIKKGKMLVIVKFKCWVGYVGYYKVGGAIRNSKNYLPVILLGPPELCVLCGRVIALGEKKMSSTLMLRQSYR